MLVDVHISIPMAFCEENVKDAVC